MAIADRINERRIRKSHNGWISAVVLVVVLGACTSTANPTERTTLADPSAASIASASPSAAAEHFPTEAFADIGERPVSKGAAAEFQAILDDMAGGAGMAATVMSPDGTWSGATGTADGIRDVRVNDQFAIASITKSIIAAQVMQMVDAGELNLHDPVTDYLPADLDFDANAGTIRDLLGQRSGIPDYQASLDHRLFAHPRRSWTAAEVLELAPDERAPAGEAFEYANANYVVLGLVIEQVRGRPVADVLRHGVLDIDGVERLIYQPDEVPTEPIAMPGGQSTAALKTNGGYLTPLADVTMVSAAAAMASDAPSLARWWRALCAGEIVSQASLNKMTTLTTDDYGLGLYDVVESPEVVGHTGGGIKGHGGVLDIVSWAGCLPEEHAVVVVLGNRVFDDIGGMAVPLAEALTSD
jgi:D-alanyl-D-alanine carboxypeptidase